MTLEPGRIFDTWPRGGSEQWDQGKGGALLDAEFFGAALDATASYTGATTSTTAGTHTASGSATASYSGATTSTTPGTHTATGSAAAPFAGAQTGITPAEWAGSGSAGASYSGATTSTTPGTWTATGSATAPYAGALTLTTPAEWTVTVKYGTLLWWYDSDAQQWKLGTLRNWSPTLQRWDDTVLQAWSGGQWRPTNGRW